MILRKFMKHVTDQNWFAVGLDVIVVITGIFLGMQVQKMYGERAERDEEKAYLKRLHAEVIQNLGFNKTNFEELLLLENFQTIEKKLDEILTVFDGRDADTVLAPDHCLAMHSASIYNDQQSYLPTLTELSASGRLSIIKNENIKSALSEYTLAFSALKQQVSQMNSARVDLFKKYPKYVKIDRRMRNILDSSKFAHECDFTAMQLDQSFNNDLTTNTAKLYYFNIILSKQQEALKKVHSVLDQDLGLSH